MLANGNTGPTLNNSSNLAAVQNELVQLQAMGYQAVMMEIGFPVLYEPFYPSQAVYQQYVGFYAQVTAMIRAMGMKIVVENDALLSSDAQAGWTNTAAYFSTLSWAQYQAGRATMAATLAQVVAPDYLVLAEEPDNEANQALQPNLDIPADAAAMVSGEIAAVQALNLPNIQLGAGVGSWVQNLTQYISDYVALPLNYIDFHIYPINTENGQSFLGNALTIASMAAAAGMPVAMSEVWLWKMENSEWQVLTPDQYLSRESFGFWQPGNILFFQTMQNLANYTQMLYQSPSEPTYYSAYQPYGGTTANGGAANCTCTTATCTVSTIITTETAVAQTAVQQSTYTGLGISYYNQLVSPADTITPSIPLNLAGSAVSTTVTLSWTASTDNVGVAGYNVIRNGVWVANSSIAAYVDSGLATSTTYNYQVQAFDMAGNTSLSSSTVAVPTAYTIPPTAPTNVVGTPYSTQGITLTWSASQDPEGVSSYEVFRGTSPSNLVQVGVMGGTTTTYKDYSLTPSTKYYYGVEATQSTYVSTMSAIVSATTFAMPSMPTHLAATPVSAQQINLTWTASTGGLPITSYQVFRGTSSSGLSQLGTRATPPYTDYAVTPATTYYYQVQATDSNGDISPMSAEISTTSLPSPNTPTNLAAAVSSGAKISLTWTETVPPKGLPIGSYQIYCGLAPGSLIKIATTATTSYTYTGLTAGTTYYCAVLAADTAGDLSVMSNPVTAITDASPNTPTNLAAAATSGAKISLTWTDTVISGGLPIGSYQVYCGLAPGSMTKVGTTAKTSYTYTGLTAGTTYYCAVLAADTAGDLSAMSVTVSAMTDALPNAPTNVVATANSATKVTVTWTESVPTGGLPITSYQVYRGTSPGNLSLLGTRATLTYTDTTVVALTTYYYAVLATDTSNEASPMSANAVVVVP
jgi:fibronectin type 3 domain-containing protein